MSDLQLTGIKLNTGCDSCGYWHEDLRDQRLHKDSYPLYERSTYIAEAKYEIRVSNGSIFLCAHCHNKHEPYIASKAYAVLEIK